MSKNCIESEDEALLLACRQGDAAAWETLVTRYQRLIYTIPRRFGLDEDLCADVFQRTFTLLWQHLNRIEQPRRLRAWLVTTARREAAQVARRQRNLQPFYANEDLPAEGNQREMIDPAPLPDALFLQLEEQQIVRMMVATLDERCARLLTIVLMSPLMLKWRQPLAFLKAALAPRAPAVYKSCASF